MPISQSKYVSITSGLGAQSAAGRKDLILRVFTTNELFPTDTVMEFTSSSDVVNFAGSTSAEAQIAAAYFGWVSKQINQPKKLSFMRYSLTATKPYLRSACELVPLTQFKSIIDGSMILSLGGASFSVTGLNFSSADTYADISSAIQAKVQSNTGGGELWTGATVTFDAETLSFILTGGIAGKNSITYAEPASEGTDVSALIGWSAGTSPVISNGTDAATLTDILNKSVDISTNFASYAFLNADLQTEDISLAGTWNDEQNFQYLFCEDVDADNYSTIIVEAAKHSGMCINYNPFKNTEGCLPAYLMPATILAATNYDMVNGTVNYMYQQFPNQTVAVSTNQLAEKLDALNINYNGQTQKSGTKIEFYQDGYNADGTDTAVYANEIWLKDAMATEVINLETALDKIPANDDGISHIEGVLQNIIQTAKENGTILEGKELTNTQKAYISQLTGDNEAWQTVYLQGYILTVKLSQKTENGRTKYIAEYSLIYSKGDVIRKVEGRHILI